jgi:hypothetical protein
MGLGGLRVQEALAGYTRGSFAPKSPWAVPEYVASEPTGVDGFGRYCGLGCYGLGQTEDCHSYEDVEAGIRAGVKAGLASVGSFEIFGETVSAAPFAEPIADFILQKVVDLSRAGADVQGRMRDLVTDAIADATGIPKVLVSIGVNELTSKLVNIRPICQPKQEPQVVATVAKVPMMEVVAVAQPQMKPLRTGLTLTAPTETPYSRHLLAAARMKEAAEREAAAKKGVSPVLIGAAALAALMLLR